MARTTGKKPSANLTEIGGTGLRAFGGVIGEEFLRQLQGAKGLKIYREMSDNDPIIGSILFIIDKLLRNVTWKVNPTDDSPAAKEEADFVSSCMIDMEHSWEEFISELLSMLIYGFSLHEIVYKIREDGRVGIAKLPIRGQETIWRWNTDEYMRDFVSIDQLLPTGGSFTIPADKLLLFRTQSYKNNFQGRSILRNAFRPWYFKKKLEEVEAIGAERDLNGFPVAYVPPNLLSANATDEEKATLAAIKRMVTNVRIDEQMGMVYPLAYDENNNQLYKFELMSTSGTRQHDTNSIITRYSKTMAMTVAADFIFLGLDKVGSFALSSDKTSTFSMAMGAWLKAIAAVLNRKLVPKLMTLNGVPKELYPQFVPGDIEKEDIATFVDAIYKLVGVGALQPDDDIDAKARELLNLPIKISNGTM